MSLKSLLSESSRSKRLISQNWDSKIVNHVDGLYEHEEFFMMMIKVHYILHLQDKYGTRAFDEHSDDKKVQKFIQMFGNTMSDMNQFANIFKNNILPREKEFAQSINYAVKLPEASDFSVWDSKGVYKSLPQIGQELHNLVEENKKNVASKTRSTKEGNVYMSLEDGWSWWQLPKPYSQIEAQMMGHSGNLTSYDESDVYYSLRNNKNEPFISLIVNNNQIVDVKGRFNEKPQEEYLDMIVDLLSDESVASSIKHRQARDVDGSIYKPDDNLFWDDFSPEQQARIKDNNPNFKG